jgi:hypothetical protein
MTRAIFQVDGNDPATYVTLNEAYDGRISSPSGTRLELELTKGLKHPAMEV